MNYFAQLQRLSSADLCRQTERLVVEERRQTAYLIAHLSEVARRKLHLELGFTSLFAYCVEHLGLSEGSTALRVQVANVCRRFPMLLNALAEGRVSLTVAGRLAPRLTPENCDSLLPSGAQLRHPGPWR